jgi:hypothetical protein
VKFVPVIRVNWLTPALIGLNPEMVGAAVDDTVKTSAESPDPEGVVTRTDPDMDPDGTVAVICVGPSTENVAGVPLAPGKMPNRTSVAPVKSEPVITTESPAWPLVGRTVVITGGGDSA